MEWNQDVKPDIKPEEMMKNTFFKKESILRVFELWFWAWVPVKLKRRDDLWLIGRLHRVLQHPSASSDPPSLLLLSYHSHHTTGPPGGPAGPRPALSHQQRLRRSSPCITLLWWCWELCFLVQLEIQMLRLQLLPSVCPLCLKPLWEISPITTSLGPVKDWSQRSWR